MNALDEKPNDVFVGYVVRNDLVKQVRGIVAMPSCELEFFLGQNSTTARCCSLAAYLAEHINIPNGTVRMDVVNKHAHPGRKARHFSPKSTRPKLQGNLWIR